MRIFDIEGNEVVLNAQILGIPPFKDLWLRDKSIDKKRVYKEIPYITFLCDNSLDNPFRGYSDSEREKILKEKYFDLEWEPDKLVLEAIQQFKGFQQTSSSRLVKALQGVVDKLVEHYEKIDFDKTDSQGRPIYSADIALSSIEKARKAVTSLKYLEREVLKEQAEADTARGGTEIGEYEIPQQDEF